MLSYNELKVGTIFLKDGEPFEVLEYAFIRMQQRKPVAQLKLRNLLSGKTANYSAHQNESFEEAEIEREKIKFLYANKGEYWFAEQNNPKNRFSLKEEIIGDAGRFLKPNTDIDSYKFGDKIIKIELPVKIEFKITECPPSVKGNTAQGGNKAATIETGAKVNVPLFINEGDVIRINTLTGEYAERVEKN